MSAAESYPRTVGNSDSFGGVIKSGPFTIEDIFHVGGGGSITHPFQITDVSDPAADPLVPTIHVRYGTVMDVVPTHVDENFTALTDDATTVIYLETTVDLAGAFVSCHMASGASKPADSDYIGYITLGSVVVASGVITTINQACTHSLRMAMCGRVVTGESLTTRGTYEFWGF